MSVRVTFLGGLGEIGRNCAAVEIDRRIALVDCGLMFPRDDMWGVDLVLPDWRWLAARRGDVQCVVLTHGHEDHVGGLGYFLEEVPVPVYGTRLSLAIAAGRVEEIGLEKDFRPAPDGRWITEGPFRFQLTPVSHSVPEGSGVVFDTPEGLIVHTGDFKLDPTPVDGRRTDLPAFARFGRRGVRLLLSDSTNAERSGVIPSEKSLGPSIRSIVGQASGRVISTCFSSHLHRVQQLADAGLAAGRFLVFMGRSMERNVRIGQELEVLHLPADRVIDIGEAVHLPPEQTMIVTTGSQGEPFSALSLMAARRHRWVDLDAGDTVLISATPVPGNETAVSRVISDMTRIGAKVFHGRNAAVHVSGHASAEELKIFLDVVRPEALVPVHGEYRHLRAHADLAEEMGVPEVLVLEDGDAVVLNGGAASVERGAVEAGYVYMDRSGVGGVSEALLRERAKLGGGGAAAVSLLVDPKSGRLMAAPRLVGYGFMNDGSAVLEEAAAAVQSAAEEHPDRFAQDPARAAVQAVRRVLKAQTGRRPVILPVVTEFTPPARRRRRQR